MALVHVANGRSWAHKLVVPEEEIYAELTTEVIHDVWCSRPACFAYAGRQIMGFRGRPGPDELDVQLIEDGPDDRRVFDAADDPRGALAVRTYCLFALDNTLNGNGGASRVRTLYMKMPTDFWAMRRKSRGKTPMWKRAHRLMMITNE